MGRDTRAHTPTLSRSLTHTQTCSPTSIEENKKATLHATIVHNTSEIIFLSVCCFLKKLQKKQQQGIINFFFLCAKIKETHDETHFTEPNRGKRKGGEKKNRKKIFFFHII